MRSKQSFLQPVSLRRWLCVPAMVLLVASSPCIAADSPIKSIDVTSDGDAYIAEAVFQTPAPPNIAWDVLTDFDRLAKWVPNVTSSKVIKREGNAAFVEQKGTARYGLAKFDYTSERRIELTQPTNIKTMQLKGSMKRVESTLQIEPDGKGTRILYHLEIVPNAIAAAVMSKKFVEGEVREQFTAIIGEMTRRAP